MISAQELMEDIVASMAEQSGRAPGQPVYGTRDIKKRHRRTAAEIQEICHAIHEILSDDNPQSVRHVFYRLHRGPQLVGNERPHRRDGAASRPGARPHPGRPGSLTPLAGESALRSAR